ncbi:salicylaldehyde dehydrogenase (modular protein) [Rhodoplanes elegans]|uniref:Salicylaldehyde dehydrogenase (Modular protein) n=2 Tax=Rhodoplanes elegans TaxID=29408 RepID=A0A327JX43_9BRAD|nr:salicylaldehyde dehydrogenase (modular protein) [Rhodoplanes elegans]RAI30631.1 salicylaldehyde dehydrogenase (modular protein) [Rhodoplanes elegans]
MLRIEDLSVSYGRHRALDGVALTAGAAEIVVVLGANGAGKSTLLKTIGGLLAPHPGASIALDGEPLTGKPAHDVVEAGIALVPEGRGIFGELTVRENLQLGAYPARARAGEKANLDRILALFPRLSERMSQTARTMSGGEQQMLAIGRALMSAPKLLLLDEPSLGLSPRVCRELFAALARIKADGIGILLVEQNATASLAIADRGYVVETGRVTLHGPAPALRENPAVRRAYLGLPAPATSSPEGNNPQPTRSPMLDVTMMVNDKDTPAAAGRTFERLNPITGEVASRASAATIADANAAADAAAAAFPAWSEMGPNARRAILNLAADKLEARAEDFAEAMTAEIGAAAPWAHFNVHLAAGMLREAAAMTTQIAGEVIPSDVPGLVAFGHRQPVGVVLGIAPWNAPVILGVRALAMPLACGNTVVLKASEICPATHRLIGEALHDAGLPAGVLNVVTNAPEDAPAVVEALIAHPAVRRVNFTGSTRVGRIVAEIAAKHLKPVLLELGGKAPCIVLDDADLDAAVAGAAFGAFANQGQICMATERIVVMDAVADAFVQKLAAKAAALPAGDPRKGPVVLGSLVSREAAERVGGLVQDAVAKGAELLAGGKIDGTIMNATVIDRVTPTMRLYTEESFGPVVAVVRVGSIDEAVRVANDTEYGLSAAVFGRDIPRAMAVARRIESGICHINGPTVHDEAQMPFGGVKASGYGRFGGRAAIAEFTELRWITVATTPRHYPF